MDVLAYSIERFYSQYIVLRSFYTDVSNLRSISSIIAVPTLPKDPPSFQSKKKIPTSQPKAPAKPKHQSIPQFQSVPVQPPPQPVQPIQPQPQLQTNPFLNFSSVPTFNPTPTFVPAPTPVTATYNPFATPEPPKATEPKKPTTGALDASLGDILQMVNAMKSPPQKRKKEEDERKKKEEEERIRREVERRKMIEAQQKKEAEIKRKKEEEARLFAEQRRKEEEEKRRKEELLEQKRKKEEEERKIREEEERKIREEESKKKMEEQIKNIVQQEASKEISALKVNIIELQTALENKTKESEIHTKNLNDEIKELERLLAQERESNRQSRQELEATKQKLDESLSASRQLQEIINLQQGFFFSNFNFFNFLNTFLIESLNQFNTSQQQLSQANQQLKDNIQTLIQAQQEENQKQIDREIEAAKNDLEAFIRKLDSPTYLGDPTATVQSIVESSKNLSNSLEALVQSRSQTKDEFCDQLRATLHVANKLFDVTKGVSRNIEEATPRQQLLDSARSAANAIANLFAILSDEVDKANETLQTSKQQLAELATSAENSSKIQVDLGTLETLAEKELLNAAQQV